ncbi:hypothetical protein VTO42DRAFT_2372 [Malbranchea cinnamomea]
MPPIPLSFATCSLPSNSREDTLDKKLQVIALAGFEGIELAFPDLLSYAEFLLSRDPENPKKVAPDDYANLCATARSVSRMCASLGLKVVMLQPFSNFEGWPKGSSERQEAIERARGWIRIMEACGTEMLQVGSTDTPSDKISLKRADIVSDLGELADMLKDHNMRLAYENWCWSTHAPTWKDVWEIVRDVDRDNVGLCLDTFQIAGSEWADPTDPSGIIEQDPNPGIPDFAETPLDKKFGDSLKELASTVPVDKIYLLQISDAYKPQPGPLAKEEIDGVRPRARWSHAYRPLPYHGGYLPVEAVTRAVLETGFTGWFSVEVFDGGPRGEGRQWDMWECARLGKEKVEKLVSRCGAQVAGAG